jgi:hypothetical protein
MFPKLWYNKKKQRGDPMALPQPTDQQEQKPERIKVVSVSVPPKKQAEFSEALATLKRHHKDPFIQQAPLIVETIIEAAKRIQQETRQV